MEDKNKRSGVQANPFEDKDKCHRVANNSFKVMLASNDSNEKTVIRNKLVKFCKASTNFKESIEEVYNEKRKELSQQNKWMEVVKLEKIGMDLKETLKKSGVELNVEKGKQITK